MYLYRLVVGQGGRKKGSKAVHSGGQGAGAVAPPRNFQSKVFYKDIEDSQTFQQHVIHEILILFMYKRVFSGDLKRARSHKKQKKGQYCPLRPHPLYTSDSCRSNL